MVNTIQLLAFDDSALGDRKQNCPKTLTYNKVHE